MSQIPRHEATSLSAPERAGAFQSRQISKNASTKPSAMRKPRKRFSRLPGGRFIAEAECHVRVVINQSGNCCGLWSNLQLLGALGSGEN